MGSIQDSIQKLKDQLLLAKKEGNHQRIIALTQSIKALERKLKG